MGVEMMTSKRRRSVILAAGILSASMLAGCTASSDTSDPDPSGTSSGPQGAVAAAPTTCKDGRPDVASIAPGKITLSPSSWPADSTMAKIKRNGRLVLGTSGDARLWGARNPVTGKIEGFDVDVATRVAQALGLKASAVQFKVLTIAQRVPALNEGSVDLVAERMTISCARWQGTTEPKTAVNLSTAYYLSGARLLVRTDSAETTPEGIAKAKQKVCGVKASTSLDALTSAAAEKKLQIQTVVLEEAGRCLVAFQEGEVDAVVGDDTTLAGLASQDQYAKVVGEPLNSSPIGFGVSPNAAGAAFTQFVNRVLEDMRTDGSLTDLYNKWMRPTVKEAGPAVPPAVYGRNLAGLKRQS
jgi:polar amino acid transport system substrate-binding protein